jgi:hypothetical protein
MKIKIEQSSEKINSNGGLILSGIQLSKINFSKHTNKALKRLNKRSDAILNSDILLSYIGLLCMGFTSFEDIEKFRDNASFKYAFGIKIIPSAETLRQRLDELALNEIVSDLLTEMNLLLIREVILKETSVTGMKLIVIDIDTSPMDNSRSCKEKIGNTYKNFLGYSPVFAYVSESGFMLNCKLKSGSEHSMSGAVEFVRKCIAMSDRLGITDRLLFRFDSGFDASELIREINDKSYYVIKRNLRCESKEWWLDHAKSHCSWNQIREGKIRYTGFVNHVHPANCENINNISVIVEAFETKVTRDGENLLLPEVRINTFWTNLPLESEEIIELYHQHGTSEQYHSELKSDMDVERLPSGNFPTNSLILQLAQIAYNLLRRISVDIVEFENVNVSRRRIRTVLLNVIYAACKFVFKGNYFRMKFGIDNRYYLPIKMLYERYA